MKRFITFALLSGTLTFAMVSAVFAADAQGDEKLPPGAKLVRIEAYPAAVTLKTPFAYSQLLLTGQLASGDRVDVTRMAKVEMPPNLVQVSARGIVRPVADGAGDLKFTLAGQTAVVPVKISGQKEQYPVSFVRDVMPMMSKIGCNAGT